MNGQDGISLSVRGTTEIVGVVVLVGMVITSASLLFLVASDAKGNIKEEIEVEESVQRAQDLDSTAADVSMQTGGGGELIDLGGVDPNRVHVVDAGHLGIELNGGSDGFDSDHACSAQIPLSAVVVDVSDSADVVYFAGGVWRVDESGASIESAPEIGVDDSGTFQFTTYNFRGSFQSSQAVVSENTDASQEMDRRVQQELLQNAECQESLNGSVDNLSVTTTLDPSGAPDVATGALSEVVPAYQRHLVEELGMTATIEETPSGTTEIRSELSGDALPPEARIDENEVVDLAGDGPGEVDDGTSEITVDKGIGNEYQVQMTVLATDVRNVTEVSRTVVVPTDLPRQQQYRVFEEERIDADLAVPEWQSVTLDGQVRVDAPDFESTTTDLYQTRTVYEYQDVEANNAFVKYEDERVDAPEQDPLEVVFVMDESGSMTEDSPTRISQARDAASQFVSVMQESAAESAADDRSHRAAVVGFGVDYYSREACFDGGSWGYCYDSLRDHQALTEDLGAVQTGIDNLDTYWKTPLWDGVDAGTDQFEANGEEDTNRIMVVLSDGAHNWDADTDSPEGNPDVSSRIQRAQNNDITVYTIGVAGSEGDVDASDLQSIATQTGGEYSFVSDSEELEDVFDQIIRDEIRSNVTVRDPAPSQSVEMLVMPEDESFDRTVPADGTLTQYDGRDVVIRPSGDATAVSMADEEDGVVRIEYESRNDTYFFLNGTDPTGDDRSASGAATRTAEGDDVVPDDPDTREEREETSVDQTVEIAAYEETPDDEDKPAYNLELERDDETVYLTVDEGDLYRTAIDGRIQYVTEDGTSYYFDLEASMIPEPGTVARWDGPVSVPSPVDVQVLEDGTDAPADAEYTVTVDGKQIAIGSADGWSLTRTDDTTFTTSDGDNLYRFDLSDESDALPEETTTWQPSQTRLDVIAYDDGADVVENDSIVDDDALEVDVDGTTYILQPGDGETVRTVGSQFVYETASGDVYRFETDDVSALGETDATNWFAEGTTNVDVAVYDTPADVPEDATGYAVNVDSVVAVVDPDEDWDSVSVDDAAGAIEYENGDETYRLDLSEDDLPDEEDRTTDVPQVYERPMTVDVTVDGETYTTPWTDTESGLGSDVTRVDDTQRSTVVSMADGDSLAFDAAVHDCGASERDPTDENVVVGGDILDLNRCTTMGGSSDVDGVSMFTDGEELVIDGDGASWQRSVSDAVGPEYLDGNTVNVSDNQVLVVMESDAGSSDDEPLNYAVVLVEVGDDAPNINEILQIDASSIEIEEDEDD